MSWRVERVAIELLEDGDEGYFGINQTQSIDGRKMADGAFYAEVWSEDKAALITQDLDQGLPPLGSYEPHLIDAVTVPEGPLQLRCFCQTEDTESWHPLPTPEEGWAGRMVQVSWVKEG